MKFERLPTVTYDKVNYFFSARDKANHRVQVYYNRVQNQWFVEMQLFENGKEELSVLFTSKTLKPCFKFCERNFA